MDCVERREIADRASSRDRRRSRPCFFSHMHPHAHATCATCTCHMRNMHMHTCMKCTYYRVPFVPRTYGSRERAWPPTSLTAFLAPSPP